MISTDALRLVSYNNPPANGWQQQLATLQQQAQTFIDGLSLRPASVTPAPYVPTSYLPASYVPAPIAMPPVPVPPPLPPVPPPPPPPVPAPPAMLPPQLPYPTPAPIYAPSYQPPAVPQPGHQVPGYPQPYPMQPAQPANDPGTLAMLGQLQGMIDNLRRQIAALQGQPAAVQPYPPVPTPYPTPYPAGVTPAPAPAPAPVPAPAPASGYGQPWQPGPGRLEGADTSHWQSDAEFQKSLQGSKWSAIKVTQGTSYVDPTFRQRWDLLGQKIAGGEMTLRIGYLFLDPGNGQAQAKHFLDTLDIHGPLPAGTRLALDWETAALKSPETLRDAANYIHQVTGLWPLIYVQASKLSVAKATVPDAPIWEAKWGSQIKTDVPFFQYSNGPGHDHDVFNGDEAALRRFAGFTA